MSEMIASETPTARVKRYEPCPACPTCGGAFVSHGDTVSTCVGCFSPPGHDHDGNCMRRVYKCATGHETVLSIVRRCPADGCAWHGKTACFCCDWFVDEWPTVAGYMGFGATLVTKITADNGYEIRSDDGTN